MPRNRTVTPSAPAPPAAGALRFSMRNWTLLAAGIVAILIGYTTLAAGSTILAPLLLVLGFVVLVPLGIIL